MAEFLDQHSLAPLSDETLRLTTLDPSQLPPMEAWNAELAAATEASEVALNEAKERKARAPLGEEMGAAMDALDDAYRLSQFREFQNAWAKNDIMVMKAEDVDKTAFDRYFPPEDTLGPAFSLSAAAERPTGPTGTAETAKILNTLPFVSHHALQSPTARQYPRVWVKDMTFPLERIIGVETFASWAGRGNKSKFMGMDLDLPDGLGDFPLDPALIEQGYRPKSRDAITAYSQRPVDKLGTESKIVIVRDTAGEYWGISTGDGSHRIAAAKLRGQDTVTINGVVEISADEDMPQIPFSVRERFA
jgi:hypothetical protein